jgi:hypothetical protein
MPSLLDTLVASKSVASKSTAGQSAGTGEHFSPEARKPSPYRAWTAQDNLGAATNVPAVPTDRYSPFRDPDEIPLAEHNPTRVPTSWPDEDPRTAVAPATVERLVGRDAIIRDPKVLEALPEQIGRTVVHPSANSRTSPSLRENNMLVQPKFGQPESVINSSSKAQVGAALRSQLPPDEQQYIRQPKL